MEVEDKDGLKPTLLEATDVHVSFHAGRGRRGRGPVVNAVDGVTVRLFEQETVGLVGESGSGKTTLGRVMVLLQPPNSGRVTLEGADYTSATGQRLIESERTSRRSDRSRQIRAAVSTRE